MLGPTKLSQLRRKLLRRQDRIFKIHKELEKSCQELQEPEVEVEELAQKEAMSETLDRIDTREREELDAIDRALRKIETGTYGFCESCGKKISLKRLEAVPWTALCGACERALEKEKALHPVGAERP